jgi:hypothetical protein
MLMLRLFTGIPIEQRQFTLQLNYYYKLQIGIVRPFVSRH